jgi:hypothetical protein
MEELYYSEKEDDTCDLELKKELFISDCTYDLIELFSSIKEVVPYFSSLSSGNIVFNIIQIISGNNEKYFREKKISKDYKELVIFIQENVNSIINNNKKYYNVKIDYIFSMNDIINCIYT